MTAPKKPDPKTVTVLSDGRGTWAGREVQTDGGPVVGVPEEVKKGDRIMTVYRSTSHYGLWFFLSKAEGC